MRRAWPRAPGGIRIRVGAGSGTGGPSHRCPHREPHPRFLGVVVGKRNFLADSSSVVPTTRLYYECCSRHMVRVGERRGCRAYLAKMEAGIPGYVRSRVLGLPQDDCRVRFIYPHYCRGSSGALFLLANVLMRACSSSGQDRSQTQADLMRRLFWHCSITETYVPSPFSLHVQFNDLEKKKLDPQPNAPNWTPNPHRHRQPHLPFHGAFL